MDKINGNGKTMGNNVYIFQVALELPLVLSLFQHAYRLQSPDWLRAAKSFRAPWICRHEVGHDRRQQHGTQASARLKTDPHLRHILPASFPVTPLSATPPSRDLGDAAERAGPAATPFRPASSFDDM